MSGAVARAWHPLEGGPVPVFTNKDESERAAQVLMSEFGPRLRRWRHYRQIKNLIDLAYPAGLSEDSLRKYEDSETVPLTTAIYRLSLALGISVQQLLHEEPPEDVSESIREEDERRAVWAASRMKKKRPR